MKKNQSKNDKKEEQRTKMKLFDNKAFVSLISDKAFMSWSLGLSVFILGYFVPFVHLVSKKTFFFAVFYKKF